MFRFRWLVVALCCALSPALALAHAVLIHSSPADGSTDAHTPLDVMLRFNSRVDGPHCMLSLVTGVGQVKPLQLAAQPAVNAIVAHLQALPPGAYALRWQAVASDGHITRGEIHFHVR